MLSQRRNLTLITHMWQSAAVHILAKEINHSHGSCSAAPASQVATAATFSAAWLEALRMMLAGLENPQGGMALPLGENFGEGLRTGAILVLGTSAAASFTGACSQAIPHRFAVVLFL